MIQVVPKYNPASYLEDTFASSMQVSRLSLLNLCAGFKWLQYWGEFRNLEEIRRRKKSLLNDVVFHHLPLEGKGGQKKDRTDDDDDVLSGCTSLLGL